MANTSPTTCSTFWSSPISQNSAPSAVSHGNLSLKGIDVLNIPYTTSNLRTAQMALPFPHPKWHILPFDKVYETVSPILEEYDPIIGYIGSVGSIRESIEIEYGLVAGDSGLDEIGGIDQSGSEVDARRAREREDSGLGGMDGFGEQKWVGYVTHEESGVRSSIKRERDAGRRRADAGWAGVRKSKRVRERR